MDEHAIHRLHSFLPHLALRQPELLELLPESERPILLDSELQAWVGSLSQRRLMEICSAWVRDSLRRLQERSGFAAGLLRTCLALGGEFDLADAVAVGSGLSLPPGDSRREEFVAALARASRVGLLIHVVRTERYCVPFPVRLALEGLEKSDGAEQELLRWRMVRHFSSIAREFSGEDEVAVGRHWRFSNLLAAWEHAADLLEESLGLEDDATLSDVEQLEPVAAELGGPLTDFARALGRTVALRPAESGGRLLLASALGARSTRRSKEEADALALLGQFHFRQGRYARSLESWRRVEALRHALNDAAGAVVAVSAAALAHREDGNRSMAAAEFLRACRMARAARLPDAEVDNANCAVRLLLDMRRTEEGIALIEGVLQSLAGASRPVPAQAELMVQLGSALRLQGRQAGARDFLLKALAAARQFQHRPAEAWACYELAHLEEESTGDAQKWARRARSLFTEVSDARGLARTNLLLARLLRAEGANVHELLVRGLRFAEQAHDPSTIAALCHIWGDIAIEDGLSQEAIGHYLLEIRALRHARQVQPLVEAHLRVAHLYAEAESWMAAATEVLRAQGLARQSPAASTPPALDELIAVLQAQLTPEQFEFIVEEVTAELDAGELTEP